jgi:glycosyltransferase involved in cell wall biosynthesis
MEGVSVVVPCYNAAAHLRPCLDSILQQNYPGPLEILVADDGSRDESLAIASAYGPPVRVLQHPGGVNRGVACTRNLCLAAATQPLIAFLDSDDVWLPGHLQALATALDEHPDAGLAYDNGAYLLPDGRVGGQRFPADHRAVTAEVLLLDCCLAINGIVLRRAVLAEVGIFEEGLRFAEDQDLWLRILERYPALYVPAQGWLYRRHGAQLTRTPGMWRFAQIALDRARQRGHYPERLLRKRQAVIDYRLGAAALAERQWWRASWHFGRAALLDPGRSIGELARWLGLRQAR